MWLRSSGLGRLRVGEELQIGDQAVIALDPVFGARMVGATLLDEEDLWVGRGEDAQPALIQHEVRELFGERRRPDARAHVDELDKALGRDAGRAQFCRPRRFGRRFRAPRRLFRRGGPLAFPGMRLVLSLDAAAEE